MDDTGRSQRDVENAAGKALRLCRGGLFLGSRGFRLVACATYAAALALTPRLASDGGAVRLVAHASRVNDESFLPPNDVQIPVPGPGLHMQEAGGLSKAQYDEVLDRIEAVYGSLIAARGGVLVVDRKWEDPQFNAFAFARQGTNRYRILFPGGLPRHPSMTQDGFTAVVCHELGHHLGGAPVKPNGLSNEGEADYFANLKCLRRMFADPEASGFSKAEDDGVADGACARSFPSADGHALCVRAVTAGRSLARTLQVASRIETEPRFDTPDPNVVARTNDSHPKPQCRLDTYFQASLCTQAHTIDLSASDPAVGACTHSRGFEVGLRPRCWYKPPVGEEPLVAAVRSRVIAQPSAAAFLETSGIWRGL